MHMPARSKANSKADLLAAQRGGAFQPPADLSAKGRQLWRDVMAIHPGSWWKPAYLPFLRAYVDAVLAIERLDGEIAKEGEVIKSKTGGCYLSPRVCVRDRERLHMMQMAVKLKISPDKAEPEAPADRRAKARGAAIAHAAASSIDESRGLI